MAENLQINSINYITEIRGDGMIDDSNRLYFIGGLTSILGGLLMLITSIMFLLQGDQSVELKPVLHGVSVVILILIVPTVIATTVLLNKEVKTGTLLGLGFATLWVVIELIAQGSQTAPLKKVNELLVNTQGDVDSAIGVFSLVWNEWSEALQLTASFFFTLAALCYGLSLRVWGNAASAYLMLIAALAFPITFIPVIDHYWFVLIKGISFIFLGGVLMLATQQSTSNVPEL